MRRTLLAVGIAVLLSIMATPHFTPDWISVVMGRKIVEVRDYGWNCWLIDDQCRYQPFFRVNLGVTCDWQQLALQTVFLAVLAAVLVNLRKPRAR